MSLAFGLALLGAAVSADADEPTFAQPHVTKTLPRRVVPERTGRRKNHEAKSVADQILLLDKVKQRVRLDFELRLRPASEVRRQVVFRLSPVDPAAPQSPALARLDVLRPKDGKQNSRKFDGRVLNLATMEYSRERKNWTRSSVRRLQFWPTDESDAKRLVRAGIPQQSWHDRFLKCRFDLYDQEVRFYLEGVLVKRWVRTDGEAGTSLLVQLDAGDVIQNIARRSLPPLGTYETIDLSRLAKKRLSSRPKLPATPVPFALSDQGRAALDLSDAQWIDREEGSGGYYAAYDSGPEVLNDVRMPMLSLPKADYVAAHVLASADKDAKSSSVLTLRVGRYGGREQVVKKDYTATIPPKGREAFELVRVPLTEVVAQDVLDDVMDVELTKEVHLARHVPDPNRFERRPLGLQSSVWIAGITFEKSPLQMHVSTTEAGNAFVEPEKPAFRVRLENITGQRMRFVLVGKATHLDGNTAGVRLPGSVGAHETTTVRLPIRGVRRGYNDFELKLLDGSGHLLLRRFTSFASLPPDRRRYRNRSPFGTWDWGGAHVTSNDSELVGTLFKKLGFRFGMSRHSFEERKKWGLAYGFEAKLTPSLKSYESLLSKHPDLPEVALQFHEDTISRRHAMRVPDLFTDRERFILNASEKKKFDKMFQDALDVSVSLRRLHPKVKISFGNGVPATKEEFYRRGLPPRAFDYAGNEAACFQRLPETQPLDFTALNASLWMDRQLLDSYGYRDKGIYQSYETCFPGDNPGNLSSETQAEYLVRHALHAMAWGMSHIRLGMLMDVGDSYYHSNWGAAGLCHAVPEVNVKPAFVAMATLTEVLDGARFVKVHDTGSASAYALEFKKPTDEHVLAFWTVRGQREFTVRTSGSGWGIVDGQGNESEAASRIMASTAPAYLVGRGSIDSVVAGRVSYAETPPKHAWTVATFGDRSAWKLVPGRTKELEEYDFMTPRRKGSFRFDAVPEFEGRGPSLRVLPRPMVKGKDTMPMYERLRLVKPVTFPQQPDEIGVWVNGNSGWGRIIFELRDAAGERWISLGAEADAAEHSTSDWNTDDPYGLSSINFDGWRYVGFPLPGNYPGELHPRPANSNWRWDKDGVVQYPLQLVGVAIALPTKVLHVARWSPVSRPEIYLQDVVVGRRPDELDHQ